MDPYRCTNCNHIYDPPQGDLGSGIAPGTSFTDIPEDWTCPECGAQKSEFQALRPEE